MPLLSSTTVLCLLLCVMAASIAQPELDAVCRCTSSSCGLLCRKWELSRMTTQFLISHRSMTQCSLIHQQLCTNAQVYCRHSSACASCVLPPHVTATAIPLIALLMTHVQELESRDGPAKQSLVLSCAVGKNTPFRLCMCSCMATPQREGLDVVSWCQSSRH